MKTRSHCQRPWSVSASLALSAALALAITGCGSSSGLLTTTGTIEATEISVAAEVAGKVTRVLVAEGDHVQAGDPMAELDRAALAIRVRQSSAALEMAEARLAEITAGARPEQLRQADEAAGAADRQAAAAAEQVAQASAALDGAAKHHAVTAQLFGQGATTQAELDAAAARLEGARAALAAARSQADAAGAQAKAARAQAELVRKGATSEQIRQLAAAVEQARATLDLAALDQERATIKAPTGGTVLRRLVEPGTLVPPGGPIATIADLDQLYLKVYVPVPQLGKVRLGQAVAVQVDAFPGRSFRAEVVQISSKAEYTPKNVQTKEERTTQVYAVKLQLREGFGDLKPGMPADVSFAAAMEPEQGR